MHHVLNPNCLVAVWQIEKKLYEKKSSPFGQMSVQGMHILMRFSSTSILLLGHALTQELWSTTKLSEKKKTIHAKYQVQMATISKLFQSQVTFIHFVQPVSLTAYELL